MITIGICDDEKIIRESIRNTCDRFFADNGQQYQCFEFASGEEVLNYQGEQIEVLFLDMELGGINGIEVKKELERKDTVWKIVFVTGYTQYVYDAFGIKTLGFIKKSNMEEEVIKWLSIAVEECQNNFLYEYETEGGKRFCKLQEIYYLESAGNYTYLHKRAEKELISYNLKACHKKMDAESMLRIHKCYVINLQQLEEWMTDKVILADGTELPIGRQYKEKATKKYREYIFEQMLKRK